jgi:hypothetical protein
LLKDLRADDEIGSNKTALNMLMPMQPIARAVGNDSGKGGVDCGEEIL